MHVGQVKKLAREWVRDHGSQAPGFCGAHLMGTLNHLSPEVSFPLYKDVDMNILLKDIQTRETWDTSYKGLILECGRVNAERYRSAEVVLSDPELASNLAVDSILADPDGILAGLQTVVAREYSQRGWVLARCETEKARIIKGL